jgi:hypothetical protein
MAGLWTKHLSVDQRTYYYNSSQGRSLWEPPPDANVHAAINLRAPTYLELDKSSHIILQQSQSSSSQQTQPAQPSQPSQPSQPLPSRPAAFLTEDLFARALQQQKQKQQQSRKEGYSASASHASTAAAPSAYLLQRAELEAFAGGKGDTSDGSKYVR